ncbi:MAG: YbaN family protein [Dysgonamonadaceae bacterium]|jgi:uncharacterized membrane protein YbaN (DUF454 family)|nr:YbaN family protein [Dysgonamonadaceae bacterium]
MKYLLIILGIISLSIGILGIFLPLLPTTPFLLLSAFLFARSSQRLHDWLLNHKIFGRYIRDFLQEKTIPLRIKIISISMLWITITGSIIFAANGKLWLQIVLLAVAAGVTVHVLSYKTKKNKS